MIVSKISMGLTLVVAAFVFSGTAHADFPKNNLHLKDNIKSFQGLDEATFNTITDTIVAAFQPMAAQFGATLVANKLWTDPTVNANATQQGNTWIINMYGGLARRPEVTPDGFALVVCHELGHHFGGYYYKQSFMGETWAASEGQADYWATQACAKKIWSKPALKALRNVKRFAKYQLPQTVLDACKRNYADPAKQDLCSQTAMGGMSLATLLSAIGSESTAPKFETPDPNVVTRTDVNHPRAQCRLDTYFQGALCTVPADLTTIPARHLAAGQNSVAAEEIASKSSCFQFTGQKEGNRPACWFKQQH